MRKLRVINIILIVLFIGYCFNNSWAGAQVAHSCYSNPIDNITLDQNTGIDLSDVGNFTEYGDPVRKDASLKWKVTFLNRTSNYHVTEGDKRVKQGDMINVKILIDPYTALGHPHTWAFIYVNIVEARFLSEAAHQRGIFRYLLPLTYSDGFFSESIWAYLERKDQGVNNWEFGTEVATLNLTQWNEVDMYQGQPANITREQRIYDKATGLVNEIYYSIYNVINEVEYIGEMTIIRTHGWGLPYNVTTLVVWIPLGLLTITIIVLFYLKVPQKIKLQREIKRLEKRE